MALLRAALKKARPWASGWGFQQRLLRGKGKLGNLGAIGRSIVGQNFISNGCCRFPSLLQSRRHYFLPPPPPQLTIDFIFYSGVVCVTNDWALPSAEFAVNTYNETEGEKKIRFARVVRASGLHVAGMMFYITLEGVDEENGELNVYYAEVLDRPYENFRELIKWQLVDESFSYPFREIRMSDWLNKEINRDMEVASNNLVSTWLQVMELQSTDYKTDIELIFNQPKGFPDPIKEILDFERSLMSTDICLPCPPKNAMDPLPTVSSDVIVPVYDITAYQKVCEYALFAVSTYNRNEVIPSLPSDDKIHLEEVLWASKLNVDNGVYYFLLLEVMDAKKELKFYNAIIKICHSKNELINWHLIDESYSKRLQKDQIRLGA